MFGFGRDKKKSLEKKYNKLMEESYRLSHTDRKLSDQRRSEAEEISRQLDELDKE